MSKEIKIYGMKCPEDNTIKYIGQTVQTFAKRLQGHIAKAKKFSHAGGKHSWILELESKGLRPEMVLIAECSDENWKEKEIFWINHYHGINALFNKAVGGTDGSFKSGDIPWNKGGGEYTEATREKMSKAKREATLSTSHKDNISKTLLGKSKSASHVENIRKGLGKIVLQLDLEGNILNEHPAASFAAEAVGCKRESIRDACNGRIKTCKGYKWKLKEIK